VSFASVGDETGEPRDPDGFSQALAAAINALLADAPRREAMGRAARERVLAHFSWRSIARETLEFYRDLLARR
jgi:starch synthase